MWNTTSNHDLDSDGDGFSDAFEILVLGTDPHDPDSHGVYLSGDVLYSGPETGTIYVQAVTESADAWSKTWQTALPAPGSYTNLVANQQSYWFKAYLDVSGNQQHEEWEPWGIYSATATNATNDLTGLDITLEDQPSIWGTLDYTGEATGDIHVLASSTPNWDTTYSTRISWFQGTDEINGDPVPVTFPVDYHITGLPPGDYIVRAFIDEDGNGQFTHLEEGGQYAVAPITVTNRVTGIDFTIGLDTDDDGIPDWWEMEHFGSATGADAGADADGYGVTNLEKYEHGGNPHVADTSGDGIKDWEAIILGLDLQQSYPLVVVGPAPSGFMLLGGGEPLPVTAGIAYKSRTAERRKFTQWGAFIQPQDDPPVYYTRLERTSIATNTSHYGEMWDSQYELNLSVAREDQTISGSANGGGKTTVDGFVMDSYTTTVAWTNYHGTAIHTWNWYSYGSTEVNTEVWTNEFCGVGYWAGYPAGYGYHGLFGLGNFQGWPTNATHTATQRHWQGTDSGIEWDEWWDYDYQLFDEYTTDDLLSFGANDFAGVSSHAPWGAALDWGDEFRHIVTGDPCNPLNVQTNAYWGYEYPARYLSTDEVTHSLRESAYRFTVVDTVVDHVYSLTWLEYFEPDPATNPGATNQLLNVREVKFVGNGGTVHVGNPAHDTASTLGTQEELYDFVLRPPEEEMGNGSKTITVIKVDTIEASSTVADNSPQFFEGHKPWPFDITKSPTPDKHLVIFFKDVVDSSLDVQDFDVELTAHVLPDDISDEYFDESWVKESGPSSGEFDRTDTFDVKYQNPKEGGVYHFEFRLGFDGEIASEANIVLPLSGAEVDGIVSADIVRANAFAATVVSNYSWLARQNPLNGIKWFVTDGRGDYLGRPDNSATPTVWAYNQVSTASSTFGMGAVATWRGTPVRVAKLSNFMVGYGAKKIGVNPVFAWMSQVIGTFNDSAASKSWDAGWAVAGGADYHTTVSALVIDIWDEADEKNQKLWPNPNAAANYVAPNSFWDPDNQFTSPGFLYMSNP